MQKRGALEALFSIAKLDNGDPLQKELSLAVLSKMAKYSDAVCDSILEETGITNYFTKLIKRGTITAQLHTISILTTISDLGRFYRDKIGEIDGLLEAIVFAVRTGIPATREKAAMLISNLASHENLKQELLKFEAIEPLQKLTLSGTVNAKISAVLALSKLGGTVPPEADIPPVPQQNQPTNTKDEFSRFGKSQRSNTDDVKHRNGLTKLFGNEFEKIINEDPGMKWWHKPFKPPRKMAKNIHKLRSPSRFSHKEMKK